MDDNKLKIVPFEPEHLAIVNPRSFEEKELLLIGDPVAEAREFSRRGLGFTGFINDQILGCAGAVQLWPGVAEAWVVSTALVPNFKLAFHRAVKAYFEIVIETLKLKRVQAAVHCDHEVSHKWVKRLGFIPEGIMPCFGPDGADYVRYGRILR